MAGRDRLDGSDKKSFFAELYTSPGRLILWLQYMFPIGGYSKTRSSARHARSPIMTFLYSTAFWVGSIAYIFLTFIAPKDGLK